MDYTTVDPTYGTRPNRNVLSKTVNSTIPDAILEGVIDIDKYHELQLVICWTMTKTFLLRGCKEHSTMTWNQLKFGLYEEGGPMKDVPYVELLSGTAPRKCNQLHLGNHTLRAKLVRKIRICDPVDPLDCYILLQKYKKICDPDQQRFYCYRLSSAQMQQQILKFGELRYQSNILSPVGANLIGRWCKILATKAGVENPEKCTNHSFRAYGITQNATNPAVPIQEGMALSGHQSAHLYLTYARNTPESEQQRLQGMRRFNRELNGVLGNFTT